jgi:small-conductance mechanosensitive channel
MHLFENLKQDHPFLEVVFLNNSLYDWLFALIAFFVVLVLLKLVQVVIISRLKKVFKRTKTELDDIFIDSLDSIYWPFYFFASFYIALQFLHVPESLEKWVFGIFMFIFAYYALKFLSRLVDFGSKVIIQKKQEHDENTAIIKLLGTIVKAVLWLVALILVLSNLGFDATSLLAGLGIGGIAIGLALQNVLGDLFSSLAIYLDKPFKEGDFIIVDTFMGKVKRVGIKTTRLESLQGEEIIMSNSDLTGSRISNYGRMKRRRIAFTVGVVYSTSAENLRRIPDIIAEAVKNQNMATFDRCHFKTFGDSSLSFEAVYYVESPEVIDYLNIQQAVNLEIVEEFEKKGIEMAFPTRTVYLKKE